MFKIHESTSVDGSLMEVCLEVQEGELILVASDGEFPLPSGALEAVMARFGAPFDPDERIVSIASLSLGGEAWLRHVRHLAGYDVIARDYLLYEPAGTEPLCALATTVSAALNHLARASRPGAG